MTVEDPLSLYLSLHSRRALEGLGAVNGDLAVDVVHDTRTSLRRLRAILATFSDSFLQVARLETDLRAVAIALGEVRDLDVLREELHREHLAFEHDALPEDASPILERLDRDLRARRRAALEALRDAARTESWDRVSAQLKTWSHHPPTLQSTDHAARLEKLRSLVQKRIDSSAGDPVALHAARKAGKRWRYAAEMLAPVEPTAAEHLVRAEELQEVLGAVQDTVILEHFLHSESVEVASSATLDLLRARNHRRFEQLVERALGLR